MMTRAVVERGNWNAYGRPLGRDNVWEAIISTAQRWQSENSDSHSAEGFLSMTDVQSSVLAKSSRYAPGRAR